MIVDATGPDVDVPAGHRGPALCIVLDADSCSSAWFGAGRYDLSFDGVPYTVTIPWSAVWRAGIPAADIVLWREPVPHHVAASEADDRTIN